MGAEITEWAFFFIFQHAFHSTTWRVIYWIYNFLCCRIEIIVNFFNGLMSHFQIMLNKLFLIYWGKLKPKTETATINSRAKKLLIIATCCKFYIISDKIVIEK